MMCHIFAHTFHLTYGNWHTLVKRLSNEAAAQLHPLILFSQEASCFAAYQQQSSDSVPTSGWDWHKQSSVSSA